MTDFSPHLLAQSFMLGTTRRPVKDNDLPLLVDKTADMDTRQLAAFALAAQALRFEPPSLIDDLQGFEPLAQSWPFMSPQSRRALISVMDKSGAAGALSEPIAFLINHYRISPHPFDFLRLSSFAKNYTQFLGPTYQSLCGSKIEAEGIFQINVDEDWPNAPRLMKLEYFYDLRQRDPEAGLAFLQKYFATQPAALRSDLLWYMRMHIDKRDQEFLESLAKDRSASVKDHAKRLLKEIPSVDKQLEQQNRLINAITLKKKGFIKRHAVLSLDFDIAQGKYNKSKGWQFNIIQSFRDVPLELLCNALNFNDAESLFEAAADDEDLIAGLAVSAFSHGQYDLLQRFAHLFPADIWFFFVYSADNHVHITTEKERNFFLNYFFQPEKMKTMPDVLLLEQLYDTIKKPLPIDKFNALHQTDLFRSYIEMYLFKRKDIKEDDNYTPLSRMVNAIARITPPEAMPILQDYLDLCPTNSVDNVQYYIKFATAIAKDAAQ